MPIQDVAHIINNRKINSKSGNRCGIEIEEMGKGWERNGEGMGKKDGVAKKKGLIK